MVPALLIALVIPRLASSQPLTPGDPALTADAEERLKPAVVDASLPSWQREFMTQLARGGRSGTPGDDGPGDRVARSEDLSSSMDGEWALDHPPPSARGYYGAIYDPVRERMVVFGGLSSTGYFNDVWALSLAGPPVWTQLAPAGNPPSARAGQSMVYDPVRDRIVIFGGFTFGFGYSDEVWTLSLAGIPTWTRLTPSGTSPAVRYWHSAIYDPVHDRMIIFGGLSFSSYLNDVWSLSLGDTPAWTALTPEGAPPSPRNRHSATYDPVRDRMLVFGGAVAGGSFVNDTWALSLGNTLTWTVLGPGGSTPTARCAHGAIYDQAHNRMVVFGGTPGPRSDARALSLGDTPAWTVLAPTGSAPSTRFAVSAILHPAGERMLVFGGSTGGPSYVNDVWALSLDASSWSALSNGDTLPSVRRDHTTIYDPVRARMLMFGGSAGNNPLNELWEMSLTSVPEWTKLAPAGVPPSARYDHSSIYDSAHDRMVVFGGNYLNDVWVLSLTNPPTWSLLTPAGTPPSGRVGHSAIYDPVRERMVVFGGYDGSYLNDVWELSLNDTPTWTPLTPAGAAPSIRFAHTAVYDPVRDRMLVFGGYGGSYLDDLWELSLAGTPVWNALTPSGVPPSARYAHSAVYDPNRDRMLVFGGWHLAYLNNETWALTLGGALAWNALAPTGTLPPARSGHSAIYDPVGDGMLVFGGADARVWTLGGWSGEASVGDKPPARVSHLQPLAPNPTSGRTTLRWSIPRSGRVRLDVFDVRGRQVRRLIDGERRAGAETLVWNGASETGARLEPGVYFVRLATLGWNETRKLVLVE